MARIRKRRPTHPGAALKEDVLDPLGLSVTAAAEALGISRKHLSNFVHEKVPCSKDLARRLAQATGSSVASWLNMQTAVDIWDAEHVASDQFATVRPLCEAARPQT